jgi:hypothetical protein
MTTGGPNNPPPATGNDFPPKTNTPAKAPANDTLFANAPDSPQYKPGSFTAGTGGLSAEARSKVEALRQLLHIGADNKVPLKDGGRASQFLPYLLVRSFTGDRGNRPFDQPGQPFQVFWESPDIWIAEGAPTATPDLPPDPGSGDVQPGSAYTLYAHVWNLGRAPILGVKVEFDVFNPSFLFEPSTALFRAMARVDLGPRTSAQCHRLVKCPTPWIPSGTPGPHQCLVVRVSSVGDTVGTSHPFDSWADRHVAQRNIHVLPAASSGGAGGATNIQSLLASLEKTMPKGATVQLQQVGAEGADAVRLVAPKLKVDPAVTSLVLGELGPDGSLRLPAAASGAGPLQVARIVPGNLLPLTSVTSAAPKPVLAAAPAAPRAATETVQVAASGASLAALLDHTALLDPATAARLPALKPPGPGLAQVLRFACYQGTQLVGGYSLVVTG